MCRVSIHADDPKLQPQADFLSCLISAALKVAPDFFGAMVACISGGQPNPPNEGYNPGDRERCN